MQEPGETYDQYCTALLKIAEGCEFEVISLAEILRDRLVFGILGQQSKREGTPKVEAYPDEICLAAKSMLAQMKVVNDSATVSAVKSDQQQQQKITETSGDR